MHISIHDMKTSVNNATVKQIIRCHNEGWQPVNIASICGVKPIVVETLLKETKLL